MGFIDKIKNALFEVEYVEVDEAETPKKEKKEKKELFKKEKKEDKPIAKKIVLPGKREEKIEELHEEELQDEDFEIRPKEEPVEEKHDEFKIMEDEDFAMDEDIPGPEILQVLDENEEIPIKEAKHADETEFLEEKVPYPEKKPIVDDYYSAPRESKPYGMDHSYNVSVHPYGTYERKEEKSYFRPSPIISPIYGILDKNYKKEDVREKREVHLTSSYSRNSLNVDDIRNKAYGEKKQENVKEKKTEEVKKEEKEEPNKFDVEKEDEDNLLVDLSDRAKPEVKELTMGDAVEYYQDLGLEYNVDYIDTSKEKATPKPEVEEEKEEENVVAEEIENPTAEIEPVVEEEHEEEKEEEVVEEKKETAEDDDNLFDLIDSMYQDKD